MNKKKIWIDLTDIAIWNGHHTGIQRVVYQIANLFDESSDSTVGYFVFDKRSKTFRIGDFSAVREQVEAAEQSVPAIHNSVPHQAALKTFAYHAYAKSPTWLKNKLSTPGNKARLRDMYHKAQNLQRPGFGHSKASTYERAIFEKGDVVLVMGKAWDYSPDFMEAMRLAKLEHNFKLIQTVYDLIPVFFPHLFGQALFKPYTQHMFEVAAISDGLLAISNSTKRDMERFCREMRLTKPSLKVMRLGDDFSRANAVKPSTISDLQKGNFLLCVGTVEVRKNHQLLYATYKEGLSRGIKLPKLVIVGGTGWYAGDVLYQFAHDPALKDLVYVMHGVDDGQLKWLYQNCLFTIYPSVYEGWGLPIAESLVYGKLCLASNTSSMPEIAGDLLEYFSPYDSGACLGVICKYLDHRTLAQKEEEIRVGYKPHAWKDTYNQARGFIDTLVGDE